MERKFDWQFATMQQNELSAIARLAEDDLRVTGKCGDSTLEEIKCALTLVGLSLSEV